MLITKLMHNLESFILLPILKDNNKTFLTYLKIMRYKIIFSLIVQTLLLSTAFGQVGIVDQNAKNKPMIAFIGTYHMGNQGNNIYKGAYDDILLPERQKELRVLIERLKAYKPNKIMIEVDVKYDSIIQDRYTKYLNNDFELTRNEIYQIGFKLAKEMGHDRIYSIDWGIFPKDELYWYENFAKTDTELDSFLTSMRKEQTKYFEKRNNKLNKLSMIDRIRILNEKESIENDHKAYFDILRIGLGDKYVGANYLSWWYGRNMKILVNIIRATESADDRILVIYGNGHSKLLNQLTKESQFFNVIDPMEVLKD